MIDWHWCENADGHWSSDRGLAYGDGLFETLRITEAGPVLADAHRQRLLDGCQLLGLPFGACEWDRWWRELQHRNWLTAQDSAGHILKLMVTRGSGGRGYTPPDPPSARVISIRAPMPVIPRGSIRVHLCRTPVTPSPLGAGLKTLSRLDQVLAAREIPPACYEGLMTDGAGRPVEGTRSNLFVLAGNTIHTPPVRQLAVAGVLRAALLRMLPELGLTASERPLTVAHLRQADGVFLANSVLGILPVERLGCMSVRYDRRIATLQSEISKRFGI